MTTPDSPETYELRREAAHEKRRRLESLRNWMETGIWEEEPEEERNEDESFNRM